MSPGFTYLIQGERFMGDTHQPSPRTIYKPPSQDVIEHLAAAVTNRLGDALPDRQARVAFTRNLSRLLNLAARIRVRYLNNQDQVAAGVTHKEES